MQQFSLLRPLLKVHFAGHAHLQYMVLLASPHYLGKHNACALHFRELKKNSHRSRRCTSSICLNVMQKSSKLQLFYQTVKIHEFLKYARRSRASKALPLDDLSRAVSAYYQRRTKPVVLDTKNVEITNPKT